MKNPLINVLKKYIQSEESTLRLENPTDLIAMARETIAPDQSNDLDYQIEILEGLIAELDRPAEVASGQ